MNAINNSISFATCTKSRSRPSFYLRLVHLHLTNLRQAYNCLDLSTTSTRLESFGTMIADIIPGSCYIILYLRDKHNLYCIHYIPAALKEQKQVRRSRGMQLGPNCPASGQVPPAQARPERNRPGGSMDDDGPCFFTMTSPSSPARPISSVDPTAMVPRSAAADHSQGVSDI